MGVPEVASPASCRLFDQAGPVRRRPGGAQTEPAIARWRALTPEFVIHLKTDKKIAVSLSVVWRGIILL